MVFSSGGRFRCSKDFGPRTQMGKDGSAAFMQKHPALGSRVVTATLSKGDAPTAGGWGT